MEIYKDLLEQILCEGEEHQDRTGVGTISLFGPQIEHDMSEGFPLLTTKRLPFRWIKEELSWFLSGSTDEFDLRDRGVDIWKEWATPEQCARFGRSPGQMGLIYGGLWRRFPVGSSPDDPGISNIPYTTDQIDQLIQEMHNNPNSRRLIVTGWHPYYQKRVTLPPCHTLWQVKCHGTDGLSLKLYARSIDSFLGLPFNIASYGLLLSLLAKMTDRTPRRLIISFGDVHIYKNHIKQVKEQLKRKCRPLPTLEINGVDFYTGEIDATVRGYDPWPSIKADVAV